MAQTPPTRKLFEDDSSEDRKAAALALQDARPSLLAMQSARKPATSVSLPRFVMGSKAWTESPRCLNESAGAELDGVGSHWRCGVGSRRAFRLHGGYRCFLWLWPQQAHAQIVNFHSNKGRACLDALAFYKIYGYELRRSITS